MHLSRKRVIRGEFIVPNHIGDDDDEGPVDCALVDCMPLACKNQRTPRGECCPVCPGQRPGGKNKNKSKEPI